MRTEKAKFGQERFFKVSIYAMSLGQKPGKKRILKNHSIVMAVKT
jgi:hypothetical protein